MNNCKDFNIIEPIDERCCTDGVDVRTETSDCSSCRPSIHTIIEQPDNSKPFTVTQCIWRPKAKIETPTEVISDDTTPTEKKKKPVKKGSSATVIESYDVPELGNFVKLPLHDSGIMALTFGEILLISFHKCSPLKCAQDLFNFKSDQYVTIGGFCINIQRDGRNIILYSASEFTCNGKATRASIYSLCDNSLNLIEEKRTESYVDENGEKREKGIHLLWESIDNANDNKHLIAFRTENDNKLVSKYYSKIKLNVTGALLPDGLNFILIRHLVICKYTGTFTTWTINIKGHICRSEYTFKAAKMIKINSVYTLAVSVRRNITSQSDATELIKMDFLTTGHMIRHTWDKYPFVIHLNPLATIPPTGFILNSFETWQQHIELVSNYLDAKDNAHSKLKTYLNDKPEVRCMIKDYVTLLLQLKPASILGLTIEYFMNLHGDVQNVNQVVSDDSETDSYFNSTFDSSSEDDEEHLLADHSDEHFEETINE